jgi:GH15 family glucan-1,4-alpha-glucosidase
MTRTPQMPPISDYGLIGDCHGSALVSQAGSIDWCCMPRLDSASFFGRLLDWNRGGFCAVTLAPGLASDGRSTYVEDSLVLETVLEAATGAVRVLDFFAMHNDGAQDPRHELIRIVECVRGPIDVNIEVAPRFDYGSSRPWLRRTGSQAFTAIGGDDGLLIWSDGAPEIEGDSVSARARLHPGERLRLVIRFVRPHLLEDAQISGTPAEDVDARLEETLAWWHQWQSRLDTSGAVAPEGVVRSALTLKALSYAPTGAIIAAATASLPETLGGERNWDYRYSWIRDSTLSADALAQLGCDREAKRFRHFILRSSAGHAEDFQVMFGIGGERRILEQELDLDGYCGSRPVRIGNGAATQLQLDTFGEILDLGWRWHRRGHSPSDDEWAFFAELIEFAIEHWRDPDHGIWEWRGEPRHFVHSKVGCWAAVDRGLRLAEECMRQRPERRWRKARQEIRDEIDARGYDADRGVFVQCFDESAMDGALLLLPSVGYLDFDDERMVRTADAIREELSVGGFLRRYRDPDGLPGEEGAFLPCSFWLAECFARQGRHAEARDVFDQAMGAANHLGLFSEQIDPSSRAALGNFPQGLTHLSQIAAALALGSCEAQAARTASPSPRGEINAVDGEPAAHA